MHGLSLLLSSTPLEPPLDVPHCGTGGEAATWISAYAPQLGAPPPSGANHLAFQWSIERRGDLVVMRDMVGDGFSNEGLTYEGMYDALEYFYEIFPDDYEFVTVLTAQESSSAMGAWAFYSPLENEVEGIGQRVSSSGMHVDGFLFMNDWEYWTGADDTATSAVFGQEFGHRWAAYVNYDLGSGERDDILGRDGSHWSYWLETSNSPVEGNSWADNRDGSFTLDAQEEVAYSDLDLYLMGLLPADDVSPFFLIDNPTGLDRRASSAPEYYYTGRDLTAYGDRIDITIDDVIRVEGPRVPAAGDAPTTFKMAIVLVLSADEQARASEVNGCDAVRERFVEVWQGDTRDLGTLDTTLGETVVDPLDPDTFASPTLLPKAVW